MQRSNNLHDPENDKYIIYDLWVCYLPGSPEYSWLKANGKSTNFTYAGRPKLDADGQWKCLKELYDKRKSSIKEAIICDHKTGDKLKYLT